MGKIQEFEDKVIRSLWDNKKEEWYFSVVDVVAVLTESSNPRRYWSDLKRKMKAEEGADQLYEKIVQLKMESSDGKKYSTDAADLQGIIRIIQFIPSPKAEPFKMWLAEVGKERVDEIIDPELTIERALQTYLHKGYSREWINQRLQAIQVRKELTKTSHPEGLEENKEEFLGRAYIFPPLDIKASCLRNKECIQKMIDVRANGLKSIQVLGPLNFHSRTSIAIFRVKTQ